MAKIDDGYPSLRAEKEEYQKKRAISCDLDDHEAITLLGSFSYWTRRKS
jgi:hypothetical protein